MKVSTENVLAFVRTLADRSHGSQVRKYTGERYIAHPVRVMETVRDYHDDVCMWCAALLHDVLEDTEVTEEELKHALQHVLTPAEADRVVVLVVELTDIFIREAYPKMNRRTRKDREAQRLSSVSAEAQSIKYADIIDNVTDIVQQDEDFAHVFVREARRMLEVMDTGHPLLREKARALVDQCLKNLPSPAGCVSAASGQ